MKKLLLSVFLAINTVPVSHLVYQQIANNLLLQDSLNTLASKTYSILDESKISIGFESVIRTDDNLYTCDIVGKNTINIYQVVDKNLKQLATYTAAADLQSGSLHGYVVENKIYYEVFIKSYQDDVHLAQYFVLDLKNMSFSDLGTYHLADTETRIIYNDNLDRVYHYQNYLIFLHSERWYVHGSTTIINLTTNEVATKNMFGAISMAYGNGLLYYWTDKGLTVNDIATDTDYYVKDTLGQEITGNIYVYNDQAFVTGLDKNTGINYINRIKLVDGALVLEKLTSFSSLSIDSVIYVNDTLYFAGTSYDVTTDINSVYLYKYQDGELKLLSDYHVKNGMEATLYYAFHDNYFEVTYPENSKFIINRYDLNSDTQKTINLGSHESMNVSFSKQETLFCFSSVVGLKIKSDIVSLEWSK